MQNENYLNVYDKNLLKFLFSYKNINIFASNKIPNNVIWKNQKNFFNFLGSCCFKNIKILYISSFFKKNSLKAYNTIYNFQKFSDSQATVVMVLENSLSKSLVSKLVNAKLIFVKPVLDEMDFNLNIYPVFVNLNNSINVWVYSNIIKSFLKGFYSRKKVICFKTYLFFLKNLLK